MDLCNPTGDTIPTMFDGVPYVFKPRSVMTVPDEAGHHISTLYLKYGIVQVHFGDDPQKIRYSGLKARAMYYRQVLEGHDLVNQRQAELKFPPIPDSDAVRQARIAYPIYEKALGHLEAVLGNEAAAKYQADLEEMLTNASPVLPQLKDATITELREEASRLGVDWKPAWSPLDIREAIEAAKAVIGVSKPTAEQPVGPSPTVAPDDFGAALVRM